MNDYFVIYERFLILKIFELDFVNFDSDNDKNPIKNILVNTGLIFKPRFTNHSPLKTGLKIPIINHGSQILKSYFYLG